MRTGPIVGKQGVGNIGLYYVCYRMSQLGWNVMPTARNARGVDLMAYSDDARLKVTVQVKALSKRAPVPLGEHLDHLFADWFIICSQATSVQPRCFILTPEEVRQRHHSGVGKNGKPSLWLQPKEYESADFAEKWERLGLIL